MKKQSRRRRSHILSNQGWEKIKDAIWQNLKKCPDEYNFTELSEQTRLPESKPLNPETVSKILRREEGADLRSIKRLFGAFGQELEKSDYTCPPQSNSETYHLNEAIPAPLGKLSGYMPSQPLNFLPRPDEFEAIKTAVLVSTHQSVAVAGTAHRVGVQGMGGIGKSVLTAEIARDEEVRRAFPDGVLWVTLGQTPMLTSWQSHLAEVLGAGQRTFTDVQLGKAFLGELLADKACLLILDDVWHTKHAAAFDALGQRCKMLLTTRDRGLITALGAVEYQLGVLSNEQSLALLALWAGQNEETLPTEAHEVVRECGNLPLALAMIGAMVRGKPDRWGNVLHKLRNADLEKIRYQFPHYLYSDLLKAIQVSVEDLEPDVQRRYLDFAVFPEDTPIPEATLQTFWEPEGLDKYETQDVVELLVERSLLRRDDKGHLSLHDLQYDYVRKQAGDLSALHNGLLSAYAKQCPNGWHTGINDGYFFEHLAYHLKESGRKGELYTLLTESPDWMEAKFIACTGDAAYMTDLELAITDFSEPLEPTQLLTLFQLHTARRVVHQRVSFYDDIHLETLVWLGREAEALNHAYLRSDAAVKFISLLAIYNALREKGRLENIVLEEAWKAARDIKPDLTRAKVLSILAATFAQVNCPNQADLVFAQTREIIQRVKDESKYAQRADLLRTSNLVDVLSTLAMFLAQGGYQDEARMVFAEARDITQKIEVERWRILSLSCLAQSLAQAGYKDEADAVFVETQHVAKKIDNDANWARENLAHILIKMKRFSEAKEMVLVIQNKENSSEVLAALATELTQAKYFVEAREIAQFIDEPFTQVVVLIELSTALANCGADEQARTVLKQARNITQTIKENQIQAKAISYLAKAIAQTGYQGEAELVFNESIKLLQSLEDNLEHNQEWVSTIKQLGISLSLAGYRAEAKILFNKAKDAVGVIKDDDKRESHILDLAEAMVQIRFLPEVEEWVNEIKDKQKLPLLLIDLASTLVQIGHVDKANVVFLQARDITQETEKDCLLTMKLGNFAVTLLRAGYLNKAMAIFSEIREIAYQTKEIHEQALILDDLSHKLAGVGLFFEAEELARSIKISEMQERALCGVCEALAELGFFAEAENSIRVLGEEWIYRAWALSRLVDALAQVGDFSKAEELVEDIEEVDRRVWSLGQLATALAQAGDQEKASTIFAKARDTVNNTEAKTGSPYKGFLESFLSILATPLAEAQRFQEALSSYSLQEGLNNFLRILADWTPIFEKVEPGLSVAILREAVRLAGWVSPGWQEIYKVFPPRTTI